MLYHKWSKRIGLREKIVFIIKAYIKVLENLDELLDRFLVFGQTTTSIVQSSPVPVNGEARKILRKGRPRMDANMKRG